MKRTLHLSAVAGLVLLASTFARSQCTVSQLAIQLKTATPVTEGCQVVFDFSWVQEVNSGNKFAYVHLWNSSEYPALEANGLAYSPTSNYPSPGDLVDALATIVINGNGTATPSIGTTYYPNASVPVLSTGITVQKLAINATSERMTIQNITLIVPSCSGSGITGDIWASQAENGKNVHCVSSDVSIVVGNPRVSGLLNCAIPRQYSVQINNLSGTSITSYYNVYLDDGDGLFEPATHDLKITSSTVGPIVVAAGSLYNSGMQSYMPYAGQAPYSNQSLWIEVMTDGLPNSTLYLITNTCIGLPVTYLSFAARRERQAVLLNWQTIGELNNTGFEIQRKTGRGDFVMISFVPTRASGGNSDSRLNYSYTDANASKEITEYRLKQIDLNGQSGYSDIRAVHGFGQEIKLLVYPNPSTNGEVNVLLKETGGNYDITLMDGYGRLVGKWNKLAANILSLRNLIPGNYYLRVFGYNSGETEGLIFVVTER